MIADLTHDGETRHRRQRRAWAAAATSTSSHSTQPRAPSFAELGEPAEERWIELEMKLMADAALVGVPSAGKILADLQALRRTSQDRRLSVHDARAQPGRGALPTTYSFVGCRHPRPDRGRGTRASGLGHEFLRHIERTALIVHVVDLTGGFEGRDPLEDYEIINRELALYADELAGPSAHRRGQQDRRPRHRGGSRTTAALAERAESEELHRARRRGDELRRLARIAPQALSRSAPLTGEGVDAPQGRHRRPKVHRAARAGAPRTWPPPRSSTTRCGSTSAEKRDKCLRGRGS